MQFSKYFQQGQKILMTSRAVSDAGSQFEALTVYFDGMGPDWFDLVLPYRAHGDEAFPFAPGMPFELRSEAFGLGVRLSASFRENKGEDRIRMQVESDLEIFQNRLDPRINVELGLRYTKGQGTLASFRNQWQRNVEILDDPAVVAKLPPFPRGMVNLSRKGIRCILPPPVAPADLCLILLLLPDEAPLCTLAEVVWLKKEASSERVITGMRFIAIRDADSQRIDRFIRQTLKESGQTQSFALT